MDFRNLPVPKLIEEIDFEALLAQRKAKFLSLCNEDMRPYWQEHLQYESEPVVKLLEENAYLEMLLRQRINEAAKAVLLPYSTGSDLDNLGALFNTERQVIQQADEEKGIPEIKESDERFRKRINLSFNLLNTAGSAGSYKAQTLLSSPEVKDCYVSRPEAGTVEVAVLPVEDLADVETLLNKVREHLNGETVRPLCDTVVVTQAQEIEYQINAKVQLFNIQLTEQTKAKINDDINKFIKENRRLGRDITQSSVISTIHNGNVQNVELIEPAHNIEIGEKQVSKCISVNLQFFDSENYQL